MSSIISAILAIANIFPIVSGWIDLLVAARIEGMKKEQRDALRKAIDERDQRDLEHAIGSPTAGKPSGEAGTIISDNPPPADSL